MDLNLNVTGLERAIQSLERSVSREVISVDEMQMIRIRMVEIFRQLNMNVDWVNGVRPRIANLEIRITQLWVSLLTRLNAKDGKNSDALGLGSSAAAGGSNSNYLPKTGIGDVPIAPTISPASELPLMKMTRSDGPNGKEVSNKIQLTWPWQPWLEHEATQENLETNTQNGVSLPGYEMPTTSARAMNSNHVPVPTIPSISPIPSQSTVAVQQPKPFDQEIKEAMDTMELEFKSESTSLPLPLDLSTPAPLNRKKSTDTRPPLDLCKPSGLGFTKDMNTPLNLMTRPDTPPLNLCLSKPSGSGLGLTNETLLFTLLSQINWASPLSSGTPTLVFEPCVDGEPLKVKKAPTNPAPTNSKNQMSKITVTSPSRVKEEVKANWFGKNPRLCPGRAIVVSKKDNRTVRSRLMLACTSEAAQVGRQKQQRVSRKRPKKITEPTEHVVKKQGSGMDSDGNKPEGSTKKLKPSTCETKIYNKPPSAGVSKTIKKSNKGKAADFNFETPLPIIGPPTSETLTAAVRLAETAPFPTTSGNTTGGYAAMTSISSADLSKWFACTSDRTTSNQVDDPVINIESETEEHD